MYSPKSKRQATRIWNVQGGLNSRIHLAVDAHGMPVRLFVTAGTVADCMQACSQIEGIDAEYLLADSSRIIHAASVTPV